MTVAVEYSGMNYKDAMAITGAGHRRVAQILPIVPGIDFAGTVEQSQSPRFRPGDKVILTGSGVGERWWGGHSAKARVKSDWLVPLPEGMTTRQAMAFGTAGFSAMLCVDTIERGGVDRGRDVLVTGAAGGSGGVATILLSRLGYRVVGSTGRPEERDYVLGLGAAEVIGREQLDGPVDGLLPERWGGAMDVVGGSTLAHLLAEMSYGGTVASLGLVGSRELHTTVLPFIMRGVQLCGVDSVYCPMPRREHAWQRLAELLPDGLPGAAVNELGLGEVVETAERIMRGEVRGRTIVRPTA